MTSLLEAVHAPDTITKLTGIQDAIREVAISTAATFTEKVAYFDVLSGEYFNHVLDIEAIPEGLFYKLTADPDENTKLAEVAQEVYKTVRPTQGDWFPAFYDSTHIIVEPDAYSEMQNQVLLSRFAGVQSRITELLNEWGVVDDYWHRY